MKKFNVKTLLFTLVLIMVMGTAFFTGCITFTRPLTTTTPPAGTTPAEVSAINPNWTPTPLPAQPNGEFFSIADVVAMVKPSVVAINTEVTIDTLFGPATQEGAGSGWVIDSDGIIVTNNHVVEDAQTITVTTNDGDSYTADPGDVFTDPLNDLAIIKINATGLPALTPGNASRLRVGDWVVAIGNALGQGIRATEGIVSRLEVSLPIDRVETLYDLIETSAAINPGNSGGPLVNLAGEVIGITSAKIASVGVEGMGYAINIDIAVPIIQELVNNGFVTRPYLGVVLYTVDQLAISEFNLKVQEGVLVLDVSADSPADDSGLREGDVIVSIGGVQVASVREFTQVLYASKIGEPLEIEYWRGSNRSTTTVYPIESPRP